jgi:hydrogenase maturation protein HypF
VNASQAPCWRIRVSGLVQGVGFRPFVWRLASELGIEGTVCNTPAGVEIEIAAEQAVCETFIARLKRELPPLSRIDSVTLQLAKQRSFAGFAIVASAGGAVATGIVPDAAICPACRREIRDPTDRRFGYPFANCTHCGPRLSIIEAIPYDRRSTAMRHFPMCTACQAEYENPADRRFHAEPIACAECGPKVWLEDRAGVIDTGDDDAIAATARLLQEGRIVAIKGIGGFHIACRATDRDAVRRLRRLKRRDAKPFALMATDIGAIEYHCLVSAAEAELLTSSTAPVVLLKMHEKTPIAAEVAPGQNRLGFMLPYSPLHVLLFDRIGDVPLVMTSANTSGEPQTIANDEARAELFEIVDAILFHDRDIVNRVDDGVCRIDATGTTVLRRARGQAPAPLALPRGVADTSPVLAMGGDLKGAFTFAGRGQATLSQHLGDLDEIRTLGEFERTIGLYRQIFGLAPDIVAVDAHPAYRSAALGRRIAEETGARLVAVQHHHAHLAACLAENAVAADAGPSLGIILDGLGWGDDETIWGGEFLLGGYGGFERMAWFEPVALPGGDAASREPWRNLVAHLGKAFGTSRWQETLDGARAADLLASKPVETVERMIAREVNSPFSSSAGRLFDAVSAALDVCFARQEYEGQAAMELEALAEARFAAEKCWPGADGVDGGPMAWDWLWAGLTGNLRAGIDRARIAARFHRSVIEATATTAMRVARRAGIGRIALSGGVFQNRLLLENIHAALAHAGYEVLVHRLVPANDGGLSLGQAAIASLSPTE